MSKNELEIDMNLWGCGEFFHADWTDKGGTLLLVLIMREAFDVMET